MTMQPLHRTLLIVCALTLTSTVGLALAQDKPNKDARRLQLMQQRFQEDKEQLEAEKAALAKQLADKDAEVVKVKSGSQKAEGALAARLAAVQAESARATAELTARLAEQQRLHDEALARKDQDIARLTKARADERATLQARYDEQTRVLGVCTDKNERLVKVGHELLQRWRDKGVLSVLRQNEPVLQLGDIEMFNLVQDYRDRIDQQQFDAQAPR